MLITSAYAQAPSLFGGGGDNMLVSLLPFILIFVIMYFLILRPQQKRVKQHQEMVKNVRRGDTVVTSGGIIAKVTKVVDDEQIEIERTRLIALAAHTSKTVLNGMQTRQQIIRHQDRLDRGHPPERGDRRRQDLSVCPPDVLLHERRALR